MVNRVSKDMKAKIIRCAMTLAAFAVVSVAQASGGGSPLHDKAGNDVADIASLQRGAKNYVNYCLGCHSMQYVRFNRLGEDLGLTDEQLQSNLMFTADKTQEPMSIAMPPKSAEAWFGQTPPDLSLISRSKGTDYLYNFLRGFYIDESKATGVNNLVLQGASMPHVLWELQGMRRAIFDEVEVSAGQTRMEFSGFEQVTKGKLNEAEYDQFVRDLVNFLDYAGSPEQLERTHLGIWVIIFLLVFLLFAYLLKVEYWKDVE